MVLKALSVVAPEVTFTLDDAKMLQRRVDYLLNLVDTCIAEYGYENVIFEYQTQ